MLSPAVRSVHQSSQRVRTIAATALCFCGAFASGPAGCASKPPAATSPEAPTDAGSVERPVAAESKGETPSVPEKVAPTKNPNARESAGSGPAALRLAPFTPGLSVRELRASGTVEFVGPFPFRYRIDFCPPEGLAANCPAPILGTATGPKQHFVAPFGGRPPTSERYVIDVVVTVLDGSSKGASLRSEQGLVVNPNGAESGERGRCPGVAGEAPVAVEPNSKPGSKPDSNR
jgi:hypothetical protein